MQRSGRTNDGEEPKADSKPGLLATVRRMRIPEAAAFLGVAPRSLEDPRWRKRHDIPLIRIGRMVLFDERALEKYLRVHHDRLSYAMLDHSLATTAQVERS